MVDAARHVLHLLVQRAAEGHVQFLDAAADRVPVVAGTNAGSTRDVMTFSRQAEELGCAGVMLAVRPGAFCG